mgnify:CR=1 FL=1
MIRPLKLIKIFRAVGLPLSMKTLHNYQVAGKLIMRRLPSGHRIIDETDLPGLLNAFSPGGSGKWSYEENKIEGTKN